MADASELGLLQMGIGEVVKLGTREVIGYVHTSPDSGGTRLSDEGAQFQRWLLFTRTENDFEVRPAPEEMRGWSVDRWNAEVKRRWKPGSLYIWARARIYVHGGTYGGVTWTSLPAAERLPLPQVPDVKGFDFQLDVTGGKAIEIKQEVTRGLAFVGLGESSAITHEYWCTGPSFQPAGRSTAVQIAPGTRSAASLKDFVGLVAPGWGPGSALSIVGCLTYQGDVAYEWL